ncbi:HPF/RaiA family ribosome-associated protein [Ramlibacter monticola]|uniref:Ribosome-associated translation inhibitor RaiA n=1 Tax=Ramlibacter monticola TaxID=1926872 RepID=A0A937CT11_9BURK|nr:HPF/RaiA family ribosome-associated protein [Ramlibacter monticola]MBL0391159.1 ribosome-associated translation inhibitor RaiA [Ramlibacter monticola]
MKLPLDLRFIGMAPSPALEEAVQGKVAQLDRFGSEVMACRVTIEQEHKHQNQGRLFSVRIDVTLPGHELAINRVQDEDAYVALRDAFDAARRKVDESMRIRRGEVKQHNAG